MASTLPHSGGSVPLSRVLFRSLHRICVCGEATVGAGKGGEESGRVSASNSCPPNAAAAGATKLAAKKQEQEQQAHSVFISATKREIKK